MGNTRGPQGFWDLRKAGFALAAGWRRRRPGSSPLARKGELRLRSALPSCSAPVLHGRFGETAYRAASRGWQYNSGGAPGLVRDRTARGGAAFLRPFGDRGVGGPQGTPPGWSLRLGQ